MGRVRYVVALVAAVTAAVVWGIGLAVYQPIMEPNGFWTDPESGASYPDLAGNNTYWPRDLRLLAILLAAAAVLLAVRATRRGALAAAGLAVVGLGADLVLDRMQVHGHTTAAWLAVGAAVVTGAAGAAGRSRAEGSETVRWTAAGTCAALAAGALIIVGPWDPPDETAAQLQIEAELWWLKGPLMLLLLAVAVAFVALGVAHWRAAAVWGAVFLVPLAFLVREAMVSYGDVAIGALLLMVLAVLPVAAARSGSHARVGVALAACAMALLPALIVVYFAGTGLGRLFTDLAGNPPVNGADTDISITVAALAAALILSLASEFGARALAAGRLNPAR